jgi:hypothetical protein
VISSKNLERQNIITMDQSLVRPPGIYASTMSYSAVELVQIEHVSTDNTVTTLFLTYDDTRDLVAQLKHLGFVAS